MRDKSLSDIKESLVKMKKETGKYYSSNNNTQNKNNKAYDEATPYSSENKSSSSENKPNTFESKNHRKSLNQRKKMPQRPGYRNKRDEIVNVLGPDKKPSIEGSVKIIPLGGVGEVGKNMTVYEYEDNIVVVDCGLIFPDSEMLGVDLVIPDYTYLLENKHKVKAVVITHGHEDHIGALPYFLKDINVPVYATKLTVGLIEGKLREHNLIKSVNLNVIKAGMNTKLGPFTFEYIRVNHSIPDAVSLCIKTPVGNIIHTGDFKVDFTPIKEDIIDLIQFGKKGGTGVQLLLSDSTNAEKLGMSTSEKTVGQTFEMLFTKAQDRRVIIASFASNVYRIQQIVDMAIKYKRKIAVSGRSMENVTEIARSLGYLTSPTGIFIDIHKANRLSPENVIIVTTGSQGEPMAALSRMASANHKQIQLSSDDFVIISAKPVPGNEKAVTRVINDLLKTGCEVVYESMYDVHVSGHAYQEELKMMLSLTKPKFFLPVHGECKQLKKHAELGKIMGVKDKNILIPSIGNVFELTKSSFRYVGDVTSGKVLIDGLGVGDVGSVVLKDRKHLSEDGLVVLVIGFNSSTGEISRSINITSRGFIYVKESEHLMEDIKKKLTSVIINCENNGIKEISAIKIRLRETLSNMIYTKTKRNPMILPIVTEF